MTPGFSENVLGLKSRTNLEKQAIIGRARGKREGHCRMEMMMLNQVPISNPIMLKPFLSK